MWLWKWGQGHQNLITSFPCPNVVSMQVWSKSTNWLKKKNRVQTRLIFTVLIAWWPWKLGQSHQNLIKSFNYPIDTIHKVWPESIIWFKRQAADKLFLGQNLKFKNGVTLKMRSWSPKSNHIFPVSEWCFCARLVKIHLMVQEIECRLNYFYSLYSVMTLKIRSMSPKSNQIF